MFSELPLYQYHLYAQTHKPFAEREIVRRETEKRIETMVFV